MKTAKAFFWAFIPYTIVGLIIGIILGTNILHVLAIIIAMIVTNMTINALYAISKPEVRAKIDHLRDVAASKK